MENISPLHKLKVLEENPDLLTQINKTILDLFHSEIIEAKDYSIGCDQIVVFAETQSGQKVIVKAPKKNFEDKNHPDFYPMHRPCSQAWLLRLLDQYNILGPRLIYLDPQDRFFIETFVLEEDYNAAPRSEKEKETVFMELGAETKKMHQIKSSKFGYMILDRENEGRFDSWLDLFSRYIEDVNECYEKKKITREVKDAMNRIFDEHKEYLRTFNDPRIVHSDLQHTNLRVKRIDGELHLSGIIDFADTIAGDPLYDVGELLCKTLGDWEVIKYFEKGYLEDKEFSTEQKKLIQFYALYFLSWLLLTNDDEAAKEKGKKAIDNIISLDFST